MPCSAPTLMQVTGSYPINWLWMLQQKPPAVRGEMMTTGKSIKAASLLRGWCGGNSLMQTFLPQHISKNLRLTLSSEYPDFSISF